MKRIVPEYYSKNFFVKKLFFERLQLAIRLAKPKLLSNKVLNVTDLGCGDGFLLKSLEKKFNNIKTFGIDIVPSVLELRKFLRAEIKVADIRNTGFPNEFFDIIFCLDVLEHFENLEQPVREIKKIIKPNGLLIISLPTESFFYKIGRLFTKGTMSQQKGPCSSPHFHNAKTIENFLLSNNFRMTKKLLLPSIPFLTLFNIISLTKLTN